MRLVQDDQRAADLVQGALGVVLCPPYVGVCVRDGDHVVGAVVFNDFTGANVEMTGVGRGCWTPSVIRDLARYCFDTLGVRRVTARTAMSNRKALKALGAMGFRPEGVARQWFDGEDAVLFGLLRTEQRIVK